MQMYIEEVILFATTRNMKLNLNGQLHTNSTIKLLHSELTLCNLVLINYCH